MFVPEALIELGRGSESAACPSCGLPLITGLASGVDLSELAIRCVCYQWSMLPRGSRYAKARGQRDYVPRTLFRYFDRDEYYEDFLAGRVWVTTIDACRNSEDADRADRFEATHTFVQPRPVWDSTSPVGRAVMKQLGVSVPPGSRVFLEGNSSTEFHPDQYMLCLSRSLNRRLMEKFSPGAKKVVRIVRPTALIDAIGKAIHEKDSLFHYECAPVLYERPDAGGSELTPRYAPWMMKPRRYSEEQEIRVVWRPQMHRRVLGSGFVEIEDIGRFVRPVNVK